jgi:hypothetical protein
MGYRTPVCRFDFPELDPDDGECYVVIRNPLLEPVDRNALDTPFTTDGRIDEVALHDRAVAKIAKLVTEWRMWDTTGAQLPLPSDDPTAVERCPAYVLRKLTEEISTLLRPTRPDPARAAAGAASTNGAKPTSRPRNPTPTLS